MANENQLVYYFRGYKTKDSIFRAMVDLGAPWPTEVGEMMDIAYFTWYSGMKRPSDFVLQNLKAPFNADVETIVNMLYALNSDVWKKLWFAYTMEYNPIQNYNIDETVTIDRNSDRNINRYNNFHSTVNGTDKETRDLAGSEKVDSTNSSDSTSKTTGTSTLQHGQTITRDNEIDSYTYGFNSADKVPTAVQIENGSEVHSGSDVTTTEEDVASNVAGANNSASTSTSTGTIDTRSNSERNDTGHEGTTDSLTGKDSTTRQRKGNVGQNSYQELLKQEFDLWKWNFFTQVFEDVDKFLVLSIYDPC